MGFPIKSLLVVQVPLFTQPSSPSFFQHVDTSLIMKINKVNYLNLIFEFEILKHK